MRTVLPGVLTGLAVAVLLARPPAGRLRRVLGGTGPPPDGAEGHVPPPRFRGRRGPRDGSSPPPARERLVRGRRSPDRQACDRTGGRRGVGDRTPLLACAIAAVALVLLLPAPVGPVAGMTVLVGGPGRLARLESAGVRREREQRAADLPLLLDLLSACLTGGADPAAAARAVGEALPGPAGGRLLDVAAALAVGTPAPDAWARLADSDLTARGTADDPFAPAARALARAATGGAPVAATVGRLAADARSRARARGEQAARRTGVQAVAPLGLCFLPAFVLLGIVPVVVGLAGPLLTGR